MNKLFIIIASALLLSGCNRLDVHQPLTSTFIKFDSAREITQSFVSNRENLNIISVCLRSPTRNLAPFRFELWQQDPATLVREISFSGGNIDNSDCTKFQFQPIPDSHNKLYLFKIISTNNSEDNLARATMYVEAYDDANYLGGSESLDSSPLQLDLHFKTHFYQSFKVVLGESWSQFVARLSLDPLFLIPYAGLIVMMTIICYQKYRS